MNDEEEDSILNKIKILENSLNNRIKNSHSISYPILFAPSSYPSYKSYNIGYTYNINIESNINIVSDNEINILSFKLPYYGVWIIKYRLELSLSIGFTCLKSSRIKLIGDSKTFIDNINNVSNFNQLVVTNSDTTIITNEINFTLKCMFVFGRKDTTCSLIIIKNDDCPILTITRIA